MNLLEDEPIIKTERLILRNWCQSDLDLFYQINSDDDVMAYFPFRRNRQECEALMERFHQTILEKSYGWFALALKENNQALGFCGLSDVPENVREAIGAPPNEPCVEIGWRLAKPNWGKGYVTEAAKALLNYGINTLDLPKIVSYAVQSNLRSIAVMERIGLKHILDKTFDYPDAFVKKHPDLKRHVFYEITKAQWEEQHEEE